MPQHGHRAVGDPPAVARGNEPLDRGRDGGHRDLLPQRVGQEPVDLAGVLDVGAHALHGGIALSHEVDEPAADDRAVPPHVQHLGHADAARSRFQQRDAFADALEHGELDAVVHELDVVAHAGAAGAREAARHRQRLQQGLDAADVARQAAGHEARAAAGARDAAAGPGVHEADAVAGEAAVAPDGVAPVRVARVHDDVAAVEVRREAVEDVVDGWPGGHGDQDAPRRRQASAKVGGRRRGLEASLEESRLDAAAPVADDAPALLHGLQGQALAHLAQADQAEGLHQSITFFTTSGPESVSAALQSSGR